MGHEDQFAPPRLSGRSALSEETFAGRCGNEKDARTPVFRRPFNRPGYDPRC